MCKKLVPTPPPPTTVCTVSPVGPNNLSLEDRVRPRQKPKCIKCGKRLKVGLNWSSGRRKHYDKTCNHCHAEKARKRYAKNPTSNSRACKKWHRKNKEKLSARAILMHKKVKLEVFAHYSHRYPPYCANPFGQHSAPYTDMRALSIDHVQGGGTVHRWKLGFSGYHFWTWLKKQGLPEGYQVLCMNCQFIKRHTNRETVAK